MKLKSLLILAALATAASTLAGCGTKEIAEALAAGAPPPPPAKNPEKTTAAGRNNGRDFRALTAGLSRDPYIPGMYQLVVYSEDHGSACYGIGDVFVKIPVSQMETIGRHKMKLDDLRWKALFADGRLEARDGNGYVDILELAADKGSARLELGQKDSDNYLTGDLLFENCLERE